MPVHAFVDTNIRLHYVSLEQIDWRSILSADRVVLHIPPVVTYELDQHKWGTNDRLRKRADRILRADHNLLVSGSTKLRDGVDVSFDPTEPAEETFTKYRLSPKAKDDRLLASVFEFRDANPGVDFVVVAADNGLRIKAYHASVKTISLADDLLLPEDPDDKDKEIKKLRDEIDALKHRLPRLKLAFVGSSTHIEIKLLSPGDLESEKRARRLSTRKQHPLMPIKKKKEPPKDNPFGISFAGVAGFSDVGVEIENKHNQAHNNALNEFFAKYDRYLDEDLDHKRRIARTVEIALQVMNDGSGVADDVDVFVEIGGVAGVFAKGTLPKAPEEPQRNELAALHLDSPRLVDILKRRDKSDESEPIVTEIAGGWRVRFRVSRVKQALEVPLPAIFVELLDDRDCGVQFDYRINTASSRTDVTGTLHLLVKGFANP